MMASCCLDDLAAHSVLKAMLSLLTESDFSTDFSIRQKHSFVFKHFHLLELAFRVIASPSSVRTLPWDRIILLLSICSNSLRLQSHCAHAS